MQHHDADRTRTLNKSRLSFTVLGHTQLLLINITKLVAIQKIPNQTEPMTCKPQRSVKRNTEK